MTHIEISLSNLIEEYGERSVKAMLSDFFCKENEEIEDFIRNKAISYEKKGLSKTVLIMNKRKSILGYYSITTKSFVLDFHLNSSRKKKYFGSSQTHGDIIPSILIGQLGKNDKASESFKGDTLMGCVFRYIADMSVLTPSVVCYVEHDGSRKLIDYYQRQGFEYIKREKDEIEKNLYCHIIRTASVIENMDSSR